MKKLFGLPVKRFSFGIKKCTGKSFGKKVSFKKGGGVKKKYKIVNFIPKTIKTGKYFLIIDFIYNPFTNNNLKLIQTEKNYFFYLPKEDSDYIGKCIKISNKFFYLGTFIPLKFLNKKFMFFYLKGTKQAKVSISKSAGTSCSLVDYKNFLFTVKLPSKKKVKCTFNTSAVIGMAGNKSFKLNLKKNAGTNRRLNKRPTVRGVAMNPIDHPHGGGEGKTSGGRPSTSPWGKLTKGVKTRKNSNEIQIR